MASDNIKVAVRSRPLIERELTSNLRPLWQNEGGNTIRNIANPQEAYAFDFVFDENHTTGDLFESCVEDVVDSAMQGFNGTIFAYGQTSSGKTHTIMGDGVENGVLHSAIDTIFQSIQDTPDREFLLVVSLMEIYKEDINDLLDQTNVKLECREKDKEVFVRNLKTVKVNNKEEVLKIVKKGQAQRHIGATDMNERSSRSHTIFRVLIESRVQNADSLEADTVSHLNIVDLAGSEKCSQSSNDGERFQEGKSINKSLSTLTRVINQLAEGNSHVSFRDSKLTRILQNALGGNSKTVIICNVTPASFTETSSTLKFASSAKKIQCHPQKNENVTEETEMKRYHKYIQEMEHNMEMEKEDKVRMKAEISNLRACLLTAHAQPTIAQSQKNARRRTWCPGVSGNKASGTPPSFFPPSPISSTKARRCTEELPGNSSFQARDINGIMVEFEGIEQRKQKLFSDSPSDVLSPGSQNVPKKRIRSNRVQFESDLKTLGENSPAMKESEVQTEQIQILVSDDILVDLQKENEELKKRIAFLEPRVNLLDATLESPGRNIKEPGRRRSSIQLMTFDEEGERNKVLTPIMEGGNQSGDESLMVLNLDDQSRLMSESQINESGRASSELPKASVEEYERMVEHALRLSEERQEKIDDLEQNLLKFKTQIEMRDDALAEKESCIEGLHDELMSLQSFQVHENACNETRTPQRNIEVTPGSTSQTPKVSISERISLLSKDVEFWKEKAENLESVLANEKHVDVKQIKDAIDWERTARDNQTTIVTLNQQLVELNSRFVNIDQQLSDIQIEKEKMVKKSKCDGQTIEDYEWFLEEEKKKNKSKIDMLEKMLQQEREEFETRLSNEDSQNEVASPTTEQIGEFQQKINEMQTLIDCTSNENETLKSKMQELQHQMKEEAQTLVVTSPQSNVDLTSTLDSINQFKHFFNNTIALHQNTMQDCLSNYETNLDTCEAKLVMLRHNLATRAAAQTPDESCIFDKSVMNASILPENAALNEAMEKIVVLQEDIEKLKQENADINYKLTLKSCNLEEKQSKIEELENVLSNKDTQFTQLNIDLGSQNSRYAELASQMDSLKTQLEDSKSNVGEILVDPRVAELEAEITALDVKLTQFDSLKNEIEEEKESKKLMETAMVTLKVEKIDLQSQISKLNNQLGEQISEGNNFIQQELQSLKEEAEKLRIDKESSEENVGKIEQKMREISEEGNTVKKELEVSITEKNILQAQNCKLTQALSDSQQKVDDINAAMETLNVEKIDLQSQISQLNNQLEGQISEGNNFIQQELQSLKEEAEKLKIDKESSDENVGKLEKEIRELSEERNGVQKELEVSITEKNILQAQNCELTQTLTDSQQKVDDINAATETLKVEKIDLQSQLQKLNDRLEEQISEGKNNSTIIQQELQSLNDKLRMDKNELVENLKKVEEEMREITEQRDGVKKELEDFTAEKNNLQAQISQLTNKLSDSQQKIDDINSKYATPQEIEVKIMEAEQRITQSELAKIEAQQLLDQKCILIEELNKANSQQESLKTIDAQSPTDFNAVRPAMVDAQCQISDLADEITAANYKIEQLQEQFDELIQASRAAQEESEIYTNELIDKSRGFEEEKKGMEIRISALKTSIHEIESDRVRKKSELTLIKEKNDIIEELQAQLNFANETIKSMQQKIDQVTELETNLAKSTKTAENRLKELKRLRIACDDIDELENRLEAEIKALKEQKQLLEKELTSAKDKVAAMESVKVECTELKLDMAEKEKLAADSKTELFQEMMRTAELNSELHAEKKRRKEEYGRSKEELEYKDGMIKRLKEDLRASQQNDDVTELVVRKAKPAAKAQDEDLLDENGRVKYDYSQGASIDTLKYHKERQKNYQLEKQVKQMKLEMTNLKDCSNSASASETTQKEKDSGVSSSTKDCDSISVCVQRSGFSHESEDMTSMPPPNVTSLSRSNKVQLPPLRAPSRESLKENDDGSKKKKFFSPLRAKSGAKDSPKGDCKQQ